MQTKCSLCLISEKELAPFVHVLQAQFPSVHITVEYHMGTVDLLFTGGSHHSEIIAEVKKRFPTFFFEGKSIAEAVHHAFIANGKTLALAESCSGGAMAAKLTAIPDASKYFLGSIVAYSNQWKERLLHVSRSTLDRHGAVSSQTVIEMVRGLMSESEADFGVAISGVLGPTGGTVNKPQGTVFIAIGKRGGSIDVGSIFAPLERINAMNYTVQLCLGALWRNVVHHVPTFS